MSNGYPFIIQWADNTSPLNMNYQQISQIPSAEADKICHKCCTCKISFMKYIKSPYILHHKIIRVRDSLKVRGQRIHVSTLIQSNVYNIITSYSVYSCNAGCVLCVNVLCARARMYSVM